MRRMLLVLLLAAVLAAPFAAFAQTFPAPGSPTILWNNSSQTAVNTTSEVSLFQYTVPAAYIATSTTVPIGSSVNEYVSNASGTSLLVSQAPQPLHFRALGSINAGPASSLNLGINLQGTNATINLNNINFASTQAFTPARLDVYLIPIATTTATPTSPNQTMLLTARFEVAPLGGVATVTAAQTQVTINNASASIMNVVARWAAASNSSSLIFMNRILRIGE